MRSFFKRSLICGFLFSFALKAQSPKSWDEQSREIKSSLKILAHVQENQLRSELNGETSGYVKISVQLESQGNFHIYEDRLRFGSEEDTWIHAPWNVQIIKAPQSVGFFDPVSKSLKKGFKGESLFEIKAEVPHRAPNPYNQGHLLPLVVYLQSCNDKICLFPVAIRIPLEISPSVAIEKSVPQGFFSKFTEKFKNTSSLQLKKLSITTLLLLFLAGIITAFTPCVYPLYPITLGIFSRWSIRYHSPPLLLALCYCAGLTLSYAVLGMASALGGVVFGSITQKPIFLLSVGFIILTSALAFSGLIPFKLPAFLERIFTKADGPESLEKIHGGWPLLGKSFFMGTGLGIVASPCVGPVLIAILSWLGTSLGQGGSRAALQGFLYLSVFGLGMSLPFLVLGHFMLRLHKRPQLGKYTPHIKHLGTVLMVGASFYFLIPGFALLKKSSPGMATSSALSLPAISLGEWKKDKWTILDFRADWCGACVELEEKTFSSSLVRPLFDSKKWDYVRVDLTEQTPENEKLAQSFGVHGLPTVKIFAPGGKECTQKTLFGFEEATEFKSRLDAAEKNCL